MTAATVPTKDMTEATLQRLVLALAARAGWRTAHFHDSRREVRRKSGERLVIGDRAAAGFPDIVLVRGRRLIFAELKTETGKPSGLQVAWMDDLRVVEGDAAGRVLVKLWRPSDWFSGEIEQTLIGAGA